MRLLSFSSSLAFLAACGAAKLAKPEVISASQATTRNIDCNILDMERDFFAVDLKPEVRADLERGLTSGNGVAVAASCTGLRVLSECIVPGTYQHAGVDPKREFVALSSTDANQLTLPFGLVRSFEASAGVASKASFELEMVLAHMLEGRGLPNERGALKGACNTASHIVTSAALGAFVLSRASDAQVEARANVAGIGAGSQSKQKDNVLASEGDIASCKSDARRCGAVLRVRLRKISDVVLAPLVVGESTRTPEEFCGANSNTLQNCQRSCDNGAGRECARLAITLALPGPLSNPIEGMRLAIRACDLNEGNGCGLVASSYAMAETPGSDLDVAERFAIKGCRAGNPQSCFIVAEMYEKGTHPDSRKTALEYTKYGCAMVMTKDSRCCAIDTNWCPAKGATKK